MITFINKSKSAFCNIFKIWMCKLFDYFHVCYWLAEPRNVRLHHSSDDCQEWGQDDRRAECAICGAGAGNILIIVLFLLLVISGLLLVLRFLETSLLFLFYYCCKHLNCCSSSIAGGIWIGVGYNVSWNICIGGLRFVETSLLLLLNCCWKHLQRWKQIMGFYYNSCTPQGEK